MKRILSFAAAIAMLVGVFAVPILRCQLTAHRLGDTISVGQFHAVAHEGSGTAAIYQHADGTYTLELKDLRTETRPDLFVYAISAPDARDNESVKNARTMPIGPLQDSEEKHIYHLPQSFDPQRFRAITIWSRKYEVNFTTAPLIFIGRPSTCGLHAWHHPPGTAAA